MLTGCCVELLALYDSMSVYIEESAREREKQNDRREKKLATSSPPASTAGAVGLCSTFI